MYDNQTAKFVGMLVTHQHVFAEILTGRDQEWAIQNPQDAIALMCEAIRNCKKNRVYEYTRPVSDGHQLILPANDGTRTIAQASDVFAEISSNFKNWNLDLPSRSSQAQSVIVLEMVKDGDYQTIFGELCGIHLSYGKTEIEMWLQNKLPHLCLSQEQVIDFVRFHKEWLCADGYGTFFLFRKGDEIPLSFKDVFVAFVRVFADGGLKVNVYSFLNGYVWGAKSHLRVVIPQPTSDL